MLHIKDEAIDLLNEIQKFSLKFLIILFLSSFFTFSGILFFFYISACTILPSYAIYDHLRPFILLSLCFIFVFIVSVSFIFYQLLNAYEKQQRNFTNLLELFLDVISHKFGNFIAGLNVNFSLLESQIDKSSSELIKRILQNTNYMEEELNIILSTLQRIKHNQFRQKNLQPIDLTNLINQQEKKYRQLTTKDIPQIIIKGDRTKTFNLEQRFAIELLLENAFKYSEKVIKIRSGYLKNKLQYVFISNDIVSKRQKGLGIGLAIVDSIAKNNDLKILWKENNYKFMVLVTW